jgi:hypothetical protein
VHGKQESYKLHGRVQRKKNLKFLGGLQWVPLLFLNSWRVSSDMVSGVANSIIGRGGTIFIYSCSQTLKTIDFKRNYAEHEYMNIAPTPIIEFSTPLDMVRYDISPLIIQKRQCHSREAQIELPLIGCELEWAFIEYGHKSLS